MSGEGPRVSPADSTLCPTGWREAPLARLADISFSSVNKTFEPGEDPVRLCNYVDVYKNDYITVDMNFMHASATKTEIDRFAIKVGDVIITKDSETPDDIGIPAVVDTAASDVVCGYHLALIRLHGGEVDPTFLAKQLGHHRLARYFGQQANGSTRYGLSTTAIANAIVRFPVVQQQRIASGIMRLVDTAIAKTEAVIRKLKCIRAGLLDDLLTRGLDRNGQLRDPLRRPEQFKPSPLGLIPKEWGIPTLADLCLYIGSGVTPRGGQDVYESEGILFIRSQNVTFEGLKLEDVAFIPKHIHLGMLRSEVFAHDILFNITGASIGRCCAMPAGLGTANVNQHVCILRVPKSRQAEATLLAAVLGSPIGQRQLDSLNTCGNRQGLNYQQLGAFIVPWPSPDERLKIAERLSDCESRIGCETDEHTKLAKLKTGLMSDLLSGRETRSSSS